MSHVRTYAFKGEMLTLREISSRTGLTKWGLSLRLASGIPLEAPRRHRMKQAVTPPEKHERPVKKYSFHGEWLTLREISSKSGLSKWGLLRRIAAGTPLETPRRLGREAGKHPYKGEMLTLNQIMERCPIEESTLRERLRQGIPLDAPYFPNRIKHQFGDEMLTRKEIAARIGIKPNVVSDRQARGKPLTDKRYEQRRSNP